MLFKDHKELVFCGRCPFLKSGYIEAYIFPHSRYDEDLNDTPFWKNLKSDNPSRIRNKCEVSEYYFGEVSWIGRELGGNGDEIKDIDLAYDLLDEGRHPKRKRGCLRLAEHTHDQMAAKFKE